jgi:hypothetical protein
VSASAPEAKTAAISIDDELVLIESRVLVARPCWRGVTGTLGTASAAVPAWPIRWFADRNWS